MLKTPKKKNSEWTNPKKKNPSMKNTRFQHFTIPRFTIPHFSISQTVDNFLKELKALIWHFQVRRILRSAIITNDNIRRTSSLWEPRRCSGKASVCVLSIRF